MLRNLRAGECEGAGGSREEQGAFSLNGAPPSLVCTRLQQRRRQTPTSHQHNNTNQPQAFGARQYALLGVVLQAALCLCLSVAAPAAALWASGGAAPLLVALGQAPGVAADAGALLARMWPVLPLLAVSETTGQCEF